MARKIRKYIVPHAPPITAMLLSSRPIKGKTSAFVSSFDWLIVPFHVFPPQLLAQRLALLFAQQPVKKLLKRTIMNLIV